MGAVSRPLTAIAAVAVAVLVSARASAITLEIPTLTLKNSSSVRFTAFEETSVIAPETIAGASPVQTPDNAYQLRVPLGAIPYGNDCLCFGYTFIVEDTASHKRTVFDVRAIPSGAFNETVVDVPFVVVDGNHRHSGTVSLPVASYHAEAPALILQVDNPETFGHVRMSGEQYIDVKIKNTSDRFPVTAFLDAERARVDTTADLFTTEPRLVPSAPTVVFKPLETRTIRIAITPKPLSAIGACLMPSKANTANGQAIVQFDYRVGPFNGDRPSFFNNAIDVRFEPNYYWLLLMLIGGAALGSAIRIVSAPKWSTKTFLGATGLAVLCAVAIDLIAMVMASSGSSFTLFNYAINPSQLTPVALIGFVCGLKGRAMVDWFDSKFRSSPGGAAPQNVPQATI
jgi:hypothetical protein